MFMRPEAWALTSKNWAPSNIGVRHNGWYIICSGLQVRTAVEVITSVRGGINQPYFRPANPSPNSLTNKRSFMSLIRHNFQDRFEYYPDARRYYPYTHLYFCIILLDYHAARRHMHVHSATILAGNTRTVD